MSRQIPTGLSRLCFETFFSGITKQHDWVYLFKTNNRNITKRCKICSTLTIKTPKGRQWRRFSICIVNFEYSSQLTFKVNKKDTKHSLTIKTPERREWQWRHHHNVNDFILMSLLSTFNLFHTFFCFYCWLWARALFAVKNMDQFFD